MQTSLSDRIEHAVKGALLDSEDVSLPPDDLMDLAGAVCLALRDHIRGQARIDDSDRADIDALNSALCLLDLYNNDDDRAERHDDPEGQYKPAPNPLLLPARCALADLEGLVESGTVQLDESIETSTEPVARTIRELREAIAKFPT